MGEVNREHVPEIGQPIYLRRISNSPWQSWYVGVFQGETSRSWLIGVAWSPAKYSKKEFEPLSKQQHDEWVWLAQNRYRISKAVDEVSDAAVLRQIAALIGYEEGK